MECAALGNGIRANSVHPGQVETPLLARGMAFTGTPASEVTRHIPLGRMGTPEEVAGLALFLASDDGAYVTGSTYMIDGGLIRNYHEQ